MRGAVLGLELIRKNNMNKFYSFGILLLFCMNAQAQTPEFICKTEKHTIQIDKIGADTYKYRAWNKPKNIESKPDMELTSKDVSISGTGVCRHIDFSFKTGKVEFLVDNNINCVEGKPPSNAIGNLYILINGEEKNRYYCLK